MNKHRINFLIRVVIHFIISLMAGLLTSCASSQPSPEPALITSLSVLELSPTKLTPSSTPTSLGQAFEITQNLPSSTSQESHTPTSSVTPRMGIQQVVSVEWVDVWDDPSHENNYWSRQTQLILGEHVLVLALQGSWAQIVAVDQASHKDPRGYPGWVRQNQLMPDWPQGGQFAVVMVPTSSGRADPEDNSNLIQQLPLDARLQVNKVNRDWLQVRLPDGRLVWIQSRDVRLVSDWNESAPLDNFFNTAQAMLGIPYQWGGTGPTALDCSGFIYRLFHAYGIAIARDADDQALLGEPVSMAEIKRGDLIFTSDAKNGKVTHVLMALGNDLVIDENSPQGLSIHSLNSFLQESYLVNIRRYFP